VHTPVLVDAALSFLAPAPGKRIVDGTLGTGGHAIGLLSAGAHVIGIDRDEAALGAARTRLAAWADRFTPVHGSFADLSSILENLNVLSVDGILLDLGLSTLQLEDASRGFSFRLDGPLDMRMDARLPRTASDLIEALGERQLEELFRRFGEERYARRIARAIKRRCRQQRRAAPWKTRELGDLVSHAVPRRPIKIHPATRVFQALRIAVNDELTHVKSFLDSFDKYLRTAGRAVVLSYHSLEDRLVKEAFARKAREGSLRLLTRRVVRPSPEEIAANPRARSARLRAVERV
jgi:16S rRNA (cytosine1402-N4)-methyltransferase